MELFLIMRRTYSQHPIMVHHNECSIHRGQLLSFKVLSSISKVKLAHVINVNVNEGFLCVQYNCVLGKAC